VAGVTSTSRPSTRPNIVYLHTHDSGRYVGAYGAPVSTPRIEALAREGMLFHQAFSAAPTCSPSRAALLTGQLPHNAGMYGLAHFGFRLHDPAQHLATTLRDASYRTAMVGVQHVSGDDPADLAGLGYTDVLDAHGLAGSIAPPAAKFVGAHVAEHPDQPFFLSVGFFETHTSPANEHLFGYPPDTEVTSAPAPTLPSTPDTRREMGSFAASAAAADAGMGQVLDALDAAGVAEDTLVIITTDHGIAMPRMKGTVTDAGLGVMLILRGPGGFTSGRTSDAMVSHLDLFPTVVDLLDLPRPAWLQGASMLPLAADPEASIRTEVVGEVTYHAAYEPMRTLRTGRHRYVRQFTDRGRPVLPNTDDSDSKDLWLSHGWAHQPVPHEALFDEVFDPHERENLVGTERAEPILVRMRSRLHELMTRTGDPLLAGDVPAANPARQIDPDAVSPTPQHGRPVPQMP